MLELINEFGKVNTWKSIEFIYYIKEKSEREIRETIPFTTASKGIMYVGINLPRKTKTCTLKIARHWWKKSKMTQTDGKIYHALGMEESVFSQWLYHPSQSTESKQSVSHYQWHSSENYNKIFSTLYGSYFPLVILYQLYLFQNSPRNFLFLYILTNIRHIQSFKI